MHNELTVSIVRTACGSGVGVELSLLRLKFPR